MMFFFKTFIYICTAYLGLSYQKPENIPVMMSLSSLLAEIDGR